MIRPLGLLPCLLTMLISTGSALAAPTVTNSVTIGPQPLGVVVEAGTQRVFVSDTILGAVVEYDGARGVVGSPINIDGQPASLAIDNQGHRLFVGNVDTTGPAVSVVDTGTGQVSSLVAAGHRVWGLAFDGEINHLYVGDPDTGEVAVVDGSTGQSIGRVPVGGAPVAIAVNPTNGEVAVAVQGNSPALALIDPNNLGNSAVRIPMPDGPPTQVGVDTNTSKFFVARGGSNPALLVLRPAATAFDNAIPIAPGVNGIAIDRNSQIYLSHAANQATIIDGATGNPVAELPFGDAANQVAAAPNHAAVDPDSSPTRVYMVDSANGTLSILTNQ